MGQHINWEFYEAHFASSRMAPYLAYCKGESARASRLYEWNNETSAAYWELLAYLEVVLRNVIDKQMQIRHSVERPCEHWLESDSRELADLNQRLTVELTQAKRRVIKNGKVLTGEQILSELPFSFWALMVSKRTKKLWPDLAAGFLGLPNRSQAELSGLLIEIRNFRNRIGHHHRIWNLDLEGLHLKILLVAKYIDPEFSTWLRTKSRIENLLNNRPK